MGHFDLKRSKNVYFNFEFSREISNSPEKIFSLFRREILKKKILLSLRRREIFKGENLFSLPKGDFKGRMSFLPSIGRFRRENLPSMFSKGDFIKSILPGRKVGHAWVSGSLVRTDRSNVVEFSTRFLSNSNSISKSRGSKSTHSQCSFLNYITYMKLVK